MNKEEKKDLGKLLESAVWVVWFQCRFCEKKIREGAKKDHIRDSCLGNQFDKYSIQLLEENYDN